MPDILYYVPGAIGVFLLLLGAFHGWKLRSLSRHCTAYGTGKVLGFVEKKMRSNTLYFPVIEFTVDGKTYRSQSTFGDNEWEFEAGYVTDFRYNPDNPNDVYLYNSREIRYRYISTACILIGGLIFIGTYYVSF